MTNKSSYCALQTFFNVKLKNRTLNLENMKFDLQLEIDSIGNEMKLTVLFSCILMKIKFREVCYFIYETMLPLMV